MSTGNVLSFQARKQQLLLHLMDGKDMAVHKHLHLIRCWRRTESPLLVDYGNICERIFAFCEKKSKPVIYPHLGEGLWSYRRAGLIPLRRNLMQCQMIFSSKPVLLENK